jgi:hypothetical protein
VGGHRIQDLLPQYLSFQPLQPHPSPRFSRAFLLPIARSTLLSVLMNQSTSQQQRDRSRSPRRRSPDPRDRQRLQEKSPHRFLYSLLLDQEAVTTIEDATDLVLRGQEAVQHIKEHQAIVTEPPPTIDSLRKTPTCRISENLHNKIAVFMSATFPTMSNGTI